MLKRVLKRVATALVGVVAMMGVAVPCDVPNQAESAYVIAGLSKYDVQPEGA